ncbi:MAG: hypothetical protein L6Q84_32770 [Polyangiaceae bacterium]|nr:hypothetical protein [Polyangiaceae bacterium]
MTALAEPIAVTLEVVRALDALGISYLVGGSLASSVHGIPRSTHDLDLLVELPGAKVEPLASALEGSFYVDRDMMLDAVRRRASFNVLHLATMFKVDVFVSDRSPLLVSEMSRRQPVELGQPPEIVQVCSAEDIVIQKLDWYEKGSRISDRQWQDVIGVLKVRGPALDASYIRGWAKALNLSALCERAFDEAGIR